MRRFVKDPEEKLDTGLDWSEWLDDGVTISSSAWAITVPDSEISGNTDEPPADLKVATSPAPSQDGIRTKVWVEGGTDGMRYRLTNSIQTDAGQTAERSIIVNVSHK